MNKNRWLRKIWQLRTTLVVVSTLVVFSGLLTACKPQNIQAESAQCPQNRSTEMAPALQSSQLNPLAYSDENINAGKQLYQHSAKPLACIECHGKNGDGKGVMADMFAPAPRDFTCAATLNTLPDGQLFWIIKKGSIGTSMPAFDKLTDSEIWQLTMYLRTFSSEKRPQTTLLQKTSSSKPAPGDTPTVNKFTSH